MMRQRITKVVILHALYEALQYARDLYILTAAVQHFVTHQVLLRILV